MPRKFRKKEESKQGNRYPRPLGFTFANILNQKTKNKEGIDKLRDLYIELYINEGMHKISGIKYTINELSTFLQIPTQTLILRINKGIERISNFFDGEEGKRLARVQFLQGLKKSTEILGLIEHQTHILMAQQGNNYVPFLSGEVNRSLGNLINAQKPLHDLLKMLSEKNQINILINTDGTLRSGGKNYLTAETALQMITEQGESMYNNPKLIEQKEATLIGLPDVSARTQDLTPIGIKSGIPKIDEKVAKKDISSRYDTHRDEALNPDDFKA